MGYISRYFMKVIRIDEIEEKRISNKEKVKVLIDKNIGKNILSSMIILEPGGIVESHKHENEEQIYITLKGKGIVKIDDEEKEVGPNNIIHIPIGAEHSVKNNSNENFVYIWVASIIKT